MSLPARIFDFTSGTLIKSQEVDDEVNQIINVIGGANIGKSIRVRNSDNAFACARFDQLGSNFILELYADGAEVFHFEKDGDIVSPFLSSVGGVYTFTAIPVGPNSDPTTGNQLTRKTYVDGKKVSFNVGFSIPDPSTASLSSAGDFGSWPVPGGGTYTITKCKIFYRNGSHTSGGSLTFKVDRIFVGNISTLNLNNTNNTLGAVYVDDIGDITPSENEIFSCFLDTRSGTITEKNVMVVIEGFRTTF
jgi:hypothetical protein